jgi:beta-lactamase superfamily II metal-dependent hydrolase
MYEWSENKLNSVKNFLKEYGKVTLIIFCIAISALALYQIIFLSTERPLRVSFLDVGQGDAILIQTPSGRTMLIDGGASDVILARLSERLSFFTRGIDVMEETHPDADHVTGLIPVLEKYKINTMVLPPVKGETKVFSELEKHINEEGSEMYIAKNGDVIHFNDGVTVHVLYPATNYRVKKNDTNDASVSVVVKYGETSFLLTGDLPSTEESQLITDVLPKHITVYKAGHHGSKYSSGEQLLTYIRPEYSVISAGKNNKYGHPNTETLERLEKYSKEILSTIDRGTITFVTDGKKMEVETDR